MPKVGLELPGKTLIVRPGGMGDLVCADIALQELGRDAREFTWLIETRSQPWARHRGLRHACYDGGLFNVLTGIWGRYPLVMNTEQRYGLAHAVALLAQSSRGRVVAFATNRGARRSSRIVPYDWKKAHETVEFARLFAAGLGLPEPPAARKLRARVEPVAGPPLVLIAGRQSPSRALDLEAWATLIGRWHAGRKFLVGGAPEDGQFIAKLVARFEGLAGRLEGGFADLCGQIARAEEVLTLDGGAVHIASYYGVPTLAVFTSGRDKKWAPLGVGSRVLRRHDLECQPCTKFGQVPPCPYEFACLKVEEVEGESVR